MLKNAIWIFVAAIVVLVLFVPAFTKMQDMKQRDVDYQAKIDDLKIKNLRLREEQRLLENDPAYLEKVAREKMGLVKDGEVVYRLSPRVREAE